MAGEFREKVTALNETFHEQRSQESNCELMKTLG
jgi:hypothetical protein